jgi:hypothetical protein
MAILSRMAIFARLVFDSFLEPLPIGNHISIAPSSARRQFVIDLRLEKGSGRVFLVGQTLPEAGGGDTAGASVVVVDKRNSFWRRPSRIPLASFEFDDTRELMVYIAPDESVAAALPDPVCISRQLLGRHMTSGGPVVSLVRLVRSAGKSRPSV